MAKKYSDFTAVSDLSLEVEQGEIFGILEPHGAGKTTTVECLQGLPTYDEGRVSVLSPDPARDTNQLSRRIGSQLQESQLPERIKDWEALDLFGSLSPQGPSSDELLADWGLAGKRDACLGACRVDNSSVCS